METTDQSALKAKAALEVEHEIFFTWGDKRVM